MTDLATIEPTARNRAITGAIETMERRQAELSEQSDAIYAAATARTEDGGALELTDDEQSQLDTLDTQSSTLEAQLVAARARSERQEQAAAARTATSPVPTGSTATRGDQAGGSTAAARVTAAARTYDPQADGTQPDFLRDLWFFQAGRNADHRAREEAGDFEGRLNAHYDEFLRDGYVFPETARGYPVPRPSGRASRVAVTSTNFGGPSSALVPEQYMRDLWAPSIQSMRPTADLCRRLPLPGMGTQISIPRVTTTVTAGAQAAEGDDLASQDPITTDLDIPIRTYGGSVELSRQSIERGNMIPELVYSELRRVLDTTINAGVLLGSGASGEVLGIIPTTGRPTFAAVDVTTKTAAKTWQMALLVADTIAENRHVGCDVLIMRQRRLTYMAGSLDSQGRPLVQPTSATALNVLGTADMGSGDITMPVPRGEIGGIPVIIDQGIPANFNSAGARGAGNTQIQDRIIGIVRGDQLLFEGGPMMLEFEQTGGKALKTLLIGYCYVAFTSAWYPQGAAIGKGTLLTEKLTIDTT